MATTTKRRRAAGSANSLPIVLEKIFWKSATRDDAIERALRAVREGHREGEFVEALGRWTIERLLDEWATGTRRTLIDGG
jgi:hypothetical protein